MATGDLVGWINSDDILYENCVDKIVAMYIKNPNNAIYYGSTSDWIDAKGEIIGKRNISIPRRDYILKYNYEIVQQGSFYPTNLVKKVGYLNEDIHYCMDLDLWLRLLKYGPVVFLPGEPIAAFRKWEETKTNTGGEKFLQDIRHVLLANGAKLYARTILKIHFYSFKCRVKKILALQ